jgi:L-threonylcarbamoyladenylate synthase
MSQAAILPVPPGDAGRAAIAKAAALLKQGEVVAFPTETVYGLGAHALDPAAVQRIYDAKGRPAWNPLIVHVADSSAAVRLVRRWPSEAEMLAVRYWPGPLTLVLPRDPVVPDIVTAGLDTVAIRVPAHPVTSALLQASGLPLAAPSANRSGEVSPTTAEHVARGLGDRIPLILDGGPTTVGIESTVLDLSGEKPVLLRPGMVSREELEALVGPVLDPPREAESTSARPSPGMLKRHYAPKAPLAVFEPGSDTAGHPLVAAAREAGLPIGAILYSAVTLPSVLVEHLPADPNGYARGLYAALHRLDERGVGCILVERPPAEPGWDAIRDRLRRAAHS